MTDMYTRTITKTTANGMDSYFVDDGQGNTFTVVFPHGMPSDAVLTTINAMAPGAV